MRDQALRERSQRRVLVAQLALEGRARLCPERLLPSSTADVSRLLLELLDPPFWKTGGRLAARGAFRLHCTFAHIYLPALKHRAAVKAEQRLVLSCLAGKSTLCVRTQRALLNEAGARGPFIFLRLLRLPLLSQLFRLLCRHFTLVGIQLFDDIGVQRCIVVVNGTGIQVGDTLACNMSQNTLGELEDALLGLNASSSRSAGGNVCIFVVYLRCIYYVNTVIKLQNAVQPAQDITKACSTHKASMLKSLQAQESLEQAGTGLASAASAPGYQMALR